MKREYEALSRLVGRNFAVLDDGNSVYLTPTGAVRDQDGKELLPAYPGRARLYERNLKQGGGASLPEAAPYQQLVTDGEGKWVAEDRLAYKEGEKVEITWDGNTEGLVSVPAAGGAFYKVSPLILTDEQIKVGTLIADIGEEFDISDLWPYMESAGVVTDAFVSADSAIFVREENADYNGAVFHETGVYFLKSSGMTIVGFDSGNQIIHLIPAEYLPTTFVPTAVIKSSDYDNALAGVAAVAGVAVTYECVNMTFEEAYKHVANGGALMVVAMYVQDAGGFPVIESAQRIINVTAVEGEPTLGTISNVLPLFWKESGITLADV